MSVSDPRGLGTLAWEELAGCGCGHGVPAGEDSHPECVSEQLGLWLDKAYVNQGYYTETAGFTSV